MVRVIDRDPGRPSLGDRDSRRLASGLDHSGSGFEAALRLRVAARHAGTGPAAPAGLAQSNLNSG
jgi:hypothetical protein